MSAKRTSRSTRRKAGQPYRYAGKQWWNGDFTLGGGNPDNGQATGRERGFAAYQAISFLRQRRQPEAPEPPSSLPQDWSEHFIRSGGEQVLYVAETFNRWAQDMTTWAKAVREDILAIEDELGMPHGDPGDPPPVPWK